jgi:hypothetical protein
LYVLAIIFVQDSLGGSFNPAPAKHIISYEKKRLMREIKRNDFTGESRLEFDAAWRNLLERKDALSSPMTLLLADQIIDSAMTIRITAAELFHLPDSSIAFRDGTAFIAELAVYHELHLGYALYTSKVDD